MAVVIFDGPCGHPDCNLSRAHRHVFLADGRVEYQYMDSKELEHLDTINDQRNTIIFWRGVSVLLGMGLVAVVIWKLIG